MRTLSHRKFPWVATWQSQNPKPGKVTPEITLLLARIYFVRDWCFMTLFVRRYQVSPGSYTFIPQQFFSVADSLSSPGAPFSALFSGSSRHLQVVTPDIICLLFCRLIAKIFSGTLYHLQGTFTSCLFPLILRQSWEKGESVAIKSAGNLLALWPRANS